MTDDPETLRLNILHYQELLKLYGKQETYDQIRRLLADAQSRLPDAEAEARYPRS